MKGLIAEIYRSTYDCKINAMYGKKEVTIVDDQVSKVFEASEESPAVRIVRRQIYGSEYIHAEPYKKGSYAFGGTFIACSDSRVRALNRYPIPLHDRQMDLEVK
jgi:hypothetical protein